MEAQAGEKTGVAKTIVGGNGWYKTIGGVIKGGPTCRWGKGRTFYILKGVVRRYIQIKVHKKKKKRERRGKTALALGKNLPTILKSHGNQLF